MQNAHMALLPKTTVVHSGCSCHSKQNFWRGVLKSHCSVIICNESIVDRVSFSAAVEIFQMAVFVWLSDGVTLHWLSRCGSPSNELMFHPVSYRSGTAPQDARSTETHAAAHVHGNHRNKHDNNMRAVAACSVTSVQLTWQLPALGTCLAETLKASIFNNWFEVALLRSTFRVDSPRN